MSDFTRWGPRLLVAAAIMIPLLILLELLNCIPHQP